LSCIQSGLVRVWSVGGQEKFDDHRELTGQHLLAGS
jgi:hypothetical protein